MLAVRHYGQRIEAFLRFLCHAKGRMGHGIHSPFVFHLVTEVLSNNRDAVSELKPIVQLRRMLAADKRTVKNYDLGAGNWSQSIRVGDIVKKSVSSPKKLQVLFQLARYLQPNIILELGTSLGISTLAFARACPQSQIITIEGSPDIAKLAEENFGKMGVASIDLRVGSFDQLLPGIMPLISPPFLVYLDGNHRYAATVNYFNILIELFDTRSCMIIDDIHWSTEMEKAWQEICLHPKSTFCLDFFYFGIIFFRENTVKTHYCLRY
ncbi:MAG: class I SAM-dependent methyltransferase [Bacteroidales bacterium]